MFPQRNSNALPKNWQTSGKMLERGCQMRLVIALTQDRFFIMVCPIFEIAHGTE
jgi:hypothetical protein